MEGAESLADGLCAGARAAFTCARACAACPTGAVTHADRAAASDACACAAAAPCWCTARSPPVTVCEEVAASDAHSELTGANDAACSDESWLLSDKRASLSAMPGATLRPAPVIGGSAADGRGSRPSPSSERAGEASGLDGNDEQTLALLLASRESLFRAVANAAAAAAEVVGVARANAEHGNEEACPRGWADALACGGGLVSTGDTSAVAIACPAGRDAPAPRAALAAGPCAGAWSQQRPREVAALGTSSSVCALGPKSIPRLAVPPALCTLRAPVSAGPDAVGDAIRGDAASPVSARRTTVAYTSNRAKTSHVSPWSRSWPLMIASTRSTCPLAIRCIAPASSFMLAAWPGLSPPAAAATLPP